MGPLVRSSLRGHRAGFAGAAVAVLLAGALLTALGVLLESGLRGGVAPQRYAGADVVVTAPQSVPVPEDLAVPLPERALLADDVRDAVAAVPGVDRAVADRSVPLTSPGRAPVEGHGWSSAALAPDQPVDGRAPAAEDEAVVPASWQVPVGRTVPLAYGGTTQEYTVVGTVAGQASRSSGRPAPVYLSDDRVAALWPHGHTAATVGVLAADGVDAADLAARIRAAVPDVDALTGVRRGDAEFVDSSGARAELVTLSGSLAGTAVIVAVFVVASTLSLAVRQRRREFALLLAVGATPRQVRSLVRREVLLVAGVCAVLGVAPGYALAAAFGGQLARAGLPADFALAYGPLPGVAAVLLAAGTAVTAAAVAARKPSRIAPVEALRTSAIEDPTLGHGRTVTGLALLGGGLAAALTPLFVPGQLGLAGAAGSVLLLLIGVGLLGPRLVTVAIGLAGPLLRRGDASLVLADANARGYTRRLAASVVTLALAIGVSCIQLFVATTVAAEADHQSRAGITADLVASAPGGIGAPLADAAAAVPGVDHVNPVVRSAVLAEYRMAGDPTVEPLGAQGVDPAALAGTLDLDVRDGSLDDLARDDAVALSTSASATVGAGVGDTVDLRLGDGTPLRGQVVAVYGRGLGFGDVTLAADTLRAHTTSGLTDLLLLDADTGAGTVDALADLGLTVQDRQAVAAVGAEQRASDSWVSVVALGVVIGYLVLAVVNTLVMVTLERRRELNLLHLLGSTPRQVRRMLRAESLLVTGTAAVIGTAVAAVPLVSIALGLSGTLLPTVPPLTYLGIIAGTVALGVGAVATSARAAMRRPSTP